jgi:2-iminobutanoate/2-iminopropanoate deaminase
MTLRAIKTNAAPGAVATYSQAIDTGGLVFTAGQVGLDPATGQLVEGGIEAQAERALNNIVAVLDAAGLTMADVVKTSCFLTDIANFEAFNAVYARFVGDPPPARSTFAVAALPRGALIEIEAVAARSS